MHCKVVADMKKLLLGVNCLLLLVISAMLISPQLVLADGRVEVPEPLSLTLLGAGIAALAGLSLYRKHK
jgi:PEP-CTERM motif